MFVIFHRTGYKIGHLFNKFQTTTIKKEVNINQIWVEKDQLRNFSKVPDKPTFVFIEHQEKKYKNLVSIQNKTIQLLERLSLVRFNDQKISETIQKSIIFTAPIHQIDTNGVHPMFTVLEKEKLPLRIDNVTEGNFRSSILRNAKIKNEDYFVSPPGNIPLKQKE